MAAGGPGNQMAADFATQAMHNPQVQEAAKEQMMNQGRAAANAASASWCESFTRYYHSLSTPPTLRPFSENFKLSQEDPAAWAPYFAKWNMMWVQANMLAFLPYWVLFTLFCVASFAIWTWIVGTIYSVIHLLGTIVFGHMGYYLMYERGGCCGGGGTALWFFVYLFMGLSVFGSVAAGSDGGWDLWFRLVYAIVAVPTFYICLSLWKMGAGAATVAGLGSAWEAGKSAMNRSGELGGQARDPNLEGGRAAPSAPPMAGPAH